MDRKTFLCILFRWFSLHFQEITYAKDIGETKGSSVETKGFFCFSLNKRTAKKAASKLNVFCIRYFLKTKRKPAKKKIQRNVFPSICSSNAEN